ncbi:MAG TPA: ATP-binding protein [Spirochaetia bacterium]
MADTMDTATQQLLHVIETTCCAVLGVDTLLRVTVWNRGAERLFDQEGVAMLGRSLIPSLPVSVRRQMEQCLGVALGGDTGRGSIVVQPRDTEGYRRLSLTAVPLRGDDGAIEGAAVIGFDAGDSARGSEDLQTLVQGIAHRFNNINASVQGMLELVLMEPDVPAPARQKVREALSDLHRSAEVTHRLLLIGNGAPTPPESLCLDQLLHSFLLFIERDLRGRGIEVETSLARTPPILASPWQINVILNALVGNAVDATLGRPVRKITVGTGTHHDGAFLSVTDTGCGISPEDLGRIFTPFFTTKGEFAALGSPQAAARGLGLSLALCQRLAHEIEGRIDVESTPGKGSCFRLVVPVHRPERV